MIDSLVSGFLTFITVYLCIGGFVGLTFLLALWICNTDAASERMPSDVRLMIDNFYTTMDMLGWSSVTFAIIIAVMWLPMKLGWRIY